jgi:hypothetical protein
VDTDAAVQQRIRALLGARRRLAQANEHRERLNGTGHGLSQLVEACAKELRRRGWALSRTSEVTGVIR